MGVGWQGGERRAASVPAAATVCGCGCVPTSLDDGAALMCSRGWAHGLTVQTDASAHARAANRCGSARRCIAECARASIAALTLKSFFTTMWSLNCSAWPAAPGLESSGVSSPFVGVWGGSRDERGRHRARAETHTHVALAAFFVLPRLCRGGDASCNRLYNLPLPSTPVASDCDTTTVSKKPGTRRVGRPQASGKAGLALSLSRVMSRSPSHLR